MRQEPSGLPCETSAIRRTLPRGGVLLAGPAAGGAPRGSGSGRGHLSGALEAPERSRWG